MIQGQPLIADHVSEFQKTILDYYTSSARTFPWRETENPYHILVSEFMLQQTQTERVIAKYTRWLELFPDVQTLAEAQLPDIFAAWSGLGYNRRACFLKTACSVIAERFDGIVPSDIFQLESLPGIGPYTARAIATFAFNRPEIFIETNVRSVYLFFFFNGQTEVKDAQLLPYIAQTLDHSNPRRWYYALMDYGAQLKKSTKNPSRNSAGYTKQSKFNGSLRQARGAILRVLVRQGGATLTDVSESEQIELDRMQKAADKMMSEGLLCEKEGVYFITNTRSSVPHT